MADQVERSDLHAYMFNELRKKKRMECIYLQRVKAGNVY
jgi:hypothetical protein